MRKIVAQNFIDDPIGTSEYLKYHIKKLEKTHREFFKETGTNVRYTNVGLKIANWPTKAKIKINQLKGKITFTQIKDLVENGVEKGESELLSEIQKLYTKEVNSMNDNVTEISTKFHYPTNTTNVSKNLNSMDKNVDYYISLGCKKFFGDQMHKFNTKQLFCGFFWLVFSSLIGYVLYTQAIPVCKSLGYEDQKMMAAFTVFGVGAAIPFLEFSGSRTITIALASVLLCYSSYTVYVGTEAEAKISKLQAGVENISILESQLIAEKEKLEEYKNELSVKTKKGWYTNNVFNPQLKKVTRIQNEINILNITKEKNNDSAWFSRAFIRILGEIIFMIMVHHSVMHFKKTVSP